MTATATTAVCAGIFASVLITIVAPAQPLNRPPTSSTPTPTSQPLPQKRILPDGTIETRLPNGTTQIEALTSPESLLPNQPPASDLDATTQNSYRAALRAYYAYRVAGYEQRQRTFAWQLRSTKYIFWTVIALVATGVIFAAIQFRVGLRSHTHDVPTQLEASTTGLKVTSPVLGVIILALSLIFFYLYLAFVYPIHEIF